MTQDLNAQIGNYTLTQELHRGKRSLIARARRTQGEGSVVLKVLSGQYPAPADVSRLAQEYRIGCELGSERVIRYHERIEHNNGAALVLEDFGGRSLAQIMAERSLSLEELLGVAIEATRALAEIHAANVIHKDISPGNLLLNEDSGELKLCDFGISSVIELQQQQLLDPNLLEGTLAYISPEQTGRMNRSLDYRADFYSLGATLYHLFAGEPPFMDADALALVHAHIAKSPEPLHERVSTVPAQVSAVIAKLMAKNAEDRYQSAGGCGADFERCLDELQRTGSISSFEPGANEHSASLRISQRLYGRERHVSELLEAFTRVAAGGRELLTVSGYSGIGKTSLINEVHKPIVSRRGNFLVGKFDQLELNQPFSAIIAALTRHVRSLLTGSEEQLERWRERLLAVFEGRGRLLTDIVPELEHIIGPQPEVVELAAARAKQRFEDILQRFVAVFAGIEHPMVLMIDDTQWIDPVSAHFLSLLMTNDEISHLLLICAYRDNEVGPSHPLMLTLQSLREAGATCTDLSVEALGLEQVCEFLGDSLDLEAAEVRPLAEALQGKTEGNPFFLTEYLRSLHDDGHLRFDAEQGRWVWALDELEQLGVTTNVVELMLARIRRYDEQAQRLLALASYLGNSFDLEALSIIAERSPLEVAKGLWPVLKEGLIIPLDQAYQYYQWVEQELEDGPSPRSVNYRFAHDRIQEAAHAAVAADERQALAVAIGRRLLAATAEQELGERVFDIVGHLNVGLSLLEDPAERLRVAELNLLAARKTKAATAYAVAVSHLRHSLELLPEDCWEAHAQLAYAVHRELVECEHLAGNSEQAEAVFELVAKRATRRRDIGDLYQLELRVLQTASQNLAACKLGVEVLREHFELDIPAEPERVEAFIAEQDAKILALTQGKDLMDFVDAPALDDEDLGMCIALLTEIWAAAQFDGNYGLITMSSQLQTSISLEAGVSDYAPSGYVAYGQVLSNRDEYARADGFGRLACELAQRINNPLIIAKTNNSYVNFIQPYRHHLGEGVEIYEESYRSCLLCGDMWWGAWALGFIRTAKLVTGDPLDEVYERAQMYHDYIQTGFAPLAWVSSGEMRVLENLRGETSSPTNFNTEDHDEAVHLAPLREHFGFGWAWYLLYKSMALYLHGEPEAALEASVEADGLREGIRLVIFYPDFFFLGALIRAGAWEQVDEQRRAELLAEIEANRDMLDMWRRSCPKNFEHRYQLVCAELARITGKHEDVLTAYEAAIEGARKQRYLHHEAMAAELAGRYCLSRGWAKAARGYLTDAHYLYTRWGAKAKVALLEQEFDELASWRLGYSQRSQPSSAFSTVVETTTTRVGFHVLDIATVIKSTQAISQEIQLGPLLERMMTIVVENAGARRGLLLIHDQERLRIEAIAEVGAPVLVRQSLPAEEFSELPSSVINFVLRTGQTLCLDDASADSQFQDDPHIRAAGVKSLLCLSTSRSEGRTFILYLENAPTTAVFTPERVSLQSVLFAQAAISLDNALLYDTLEQTVDRRTKQLRDKNGELATTLVRLRETQDRMIVQDRLASLGSLTAGIAHELRNPLNFVINFADVSAHLTTDLTEQLTSLGKGELEAREECDELIGDLRSNMQLIVGHGKRAEGIIRSMLAHSRDEIGSVETLEINAVLEEYATLAYRGLCSRDSNFSVELETRFDPAAGQVVGVSSELGRVFINVIQNAYYAVSEKLGAGQETEEGFRPCIEVSSHDRGDSVELRIRDNGTGISAELRDKIFNPFFTTKKGTEGAGLGLSLSHDVIVKGHGGSIEVDSEVGRYTVFTILLPRSR